MTQTKKVLPSYKWVKVISVSGSGTTEDTTTGDGPIVLNDVLPASSVIQEVKSVSEGYVIDVRFSTIQSYICFLQTIWFTIRSS